MDIRTIVRAFRFGEMQRKHEQDPGMKRPPTMMFLGVVVVLVAGVAGGIYWVEQSASTPEGLALEVPGPTTSAPGNNSTVVSPPAGSGGFSPASVR